MNTPAPIKEDALILVLAVVDAVLSSNVVLSGAVQTKLTCVLVAKGMLKKGLSVFIFLTIFLTVIDNVNAVSLTIRYTKMSKSIKLTTVLMPQIEDGSTDASRVRPSAMNTESGMFMDTMG